MRKIFIAVLLPVFMMFAGCTAVTDALNLGPSKEIKAETPNEQLIAMNLHYQSALKTLEGMVDNGVLKGADADKALTLATEAKTAFHSAEDVVKQGGPNAITYLNAANSAILRLTTYLMEKQNAGNTSGAERSFYSPSIYSAEYRSYHAHQRYLVQGPI